MSARPSSDVDARAAPSAADEDEEAEAEAGDEAEWRTVLSAFRMYKAAYGDLKVPAKFVVPGMAPWPEPAWKMKLGQRVAAIRGTGRYVQENESRRKTLDDMGFLWRLRAPSPSKTLDGISFEQVAAALEAYRAQAPGGDGDDGGGGGGGSPPEVPAQFVVPDCEPWPESTRGLPLGKVLPTVRGPTYLARQPPEAAARLAALGFPPDVRAATATNDARYRRVYDALARYKELHGDLRVPAAFTVPEDGKDAWPEEVRGLRLGARVNAIRGQGTFVKAHPARRAELDALGFVWDLPGDGGGRGRKRNDDGATTDDGGEVEGEAVEGGGGRDSSAAAATEAPGELPFGMTRDPFYTGDQQRPPQWAFEGDDDEEAALEQQRVEELKYTPPKSFNETLEEMAQVAMSVGIMERWTPHKRVKKGTRPKQIPWHNDDFGPGFTFDDVVEALSLYKELYKNFDNIEEDKFVVPVPVTESLRLSPFELAGMNDDLRGDVDEIDRPWNENEEGESLENEFSVVAHDDWPVHLGGMNLGRIVTRMREGALEVKHLPERKARLDAIGFDWGDPRRFIDVPFEKVLCMLYAFFMIRGNTAVTHDFVMPDEEPWPTIFAGYELGAAVKRLRELQNFLEAYHFEKVSRLAMFDFEFFPDMALPLDPNAGPPNPEHEFVEAVGHPLYHVNAVPLGVPERALAGGPKDSSGTVSSWYNYDYIREVYEGAYIGPADWMRKLGFFTLAEEHEEKYGLSPFRQMFFLAQLAHNTDISDEALEEEYIRISEEYKEELKIWAQGKTYDQLKEQSGRGTFEDFSDYDESISEDEYYYKTLEIASNSPSNSPDSLLPQQQMKIPNDVIEESVPDFSLGGGDGDEEPPLG